MKKILLTLTVLAFSMTYRVYSQSELPKFASNIDKIKVRLDMPLEGRLYKNGTGYTKPKDVGRHAQKGSARFVLYV